MNFNKSKAFTMAEVMILLLTLSIMLAAIAPIMTKRQVSLASDNIWSFVSGDVESDAYYSTIEQSATGQAFVGLSPSNKLDVSNSIKDDDGRYAYSKLVIRPSNKLKTSHKHQNQILFRAGDTNAGKFAGSLFAGARNFLLGGEYKDIEINDDSIFSNTVADAIANTAYGYNALTKLTKGQHNTAVGLFALSENTTGSYNTAVGANAGQSLDSVDGNTLVGYSAASNLKLRRNGTDKYGYYNTVVGYNALSNAAPNLGLQANTILGNNAYPNPPADMTYSIGNTAAGYSTLSSVSAGFPVSYNTAIGYNSMRNLISGQYNTAFGYNSCNSLINGNNKTCIGANAGSSSDLGSPYDKLFVDSYERVFIGSMPKDTVHPENLPAAVLEVHNMKNYYGSYTTSNSMPIEDVGHESVVINGNLIVRGQSYFEAPIIRNASSVVLQHTIKTYPECNDGHCNSLVYYRYTPKGLMAFNLWSPARNTYMLMGYDGNDQTEKSHQSCGGRCKKHNYNDVGPNCICTAMSEKHCNHPTTYAGKTLGGYNKLLPVSTSYDWTTPSNFDIVGNHDDCFKDKSTFGSGYADKSVVDSKGNRLGGDDGCLAKFEYNPSFRHGQKGDADDYHDYVHTKVRKGMRNVNILRTDKPLAHLRDKDNDNIGNDWKSNPDVSATSCCPDLRSDARLKNIGEKFVAGLEEIKRINI